MLAKVTRSWWISDLRNKKNLAGTHLWSLAICQVLRISYKLPNYTKVLSSKIHNLQSNLMIKLPSYEITNLQNPDNKVPNSSKLPIVTDFHAVTKFSRN
jgi:hypothetical protein